METTEELRKITQTEKVVDRERPWLYKSLQRGPSIYLTKIFLKTTITPNQISLLMILVGLSGAVLVYFPSFGYKLAGLIFLGLNIILDKVDGEVARFKKIFSIRGIYLDEINHLVIPPIFFGSLMFGLIKFSAFDTLLLVFFGIMASISMPFIRVGWSLAPQIYAKKFIKHPEIFNLPLPNQETSVQSAKRNFKLISFVLGIFHQFQEFFMIILTFLVALLLEEFFVHKPILVWLLFTYGIILPIIFLENTIKGYLSIEQRVSNLNDRFKITEEK